MPSFEQQQNRNHSKNAVPPARLDQIKSPTDPIGNPFPEHFQVLGNQAMQHLLYSRVIQAKLKIGQPGDKYEQEADRVAEQVMLMPEPHIQRKVEQEKEAIHIKPLADQITPLVQRQVDSEEEEEPTQAEFSENVVLKRQKEPEKVKENLIQAKQAAGQTFRSALGLQAQIRSLRDGGQPLPESARSFFEPRFGYDFSKVRIHTGNSAAEVARAVHARAFTIGRDIVFGAGQYAPGTAKGQRLLAHELVHMIQQGQGRSSELFAHSSTALIQCKIALPHTNQSAVHPFFRRNRFYDYFLSRRRGSGVLVTARGTRPPGLVQEIFWSLAHSALEYQRTLRELSREVRIRKIIVHAAQTLSIGRIPRIPFGPFRKPAWGIMQKGELIGKKGGVRVNTKFWDLKTTVYPLLKRFDLIMCSKPGVKSSQAIQDIWDNPELYAYECLTSTVFIQYRAMLGRKGPAEFDRRFPSGIKLEFFYDHTLGVPAALMPLIVQGLKHINVGSVNNFDELVPGDQTNFEPAIQNAIYIGQGLFFVHPYGLIRRTHHALRRLKLSESRFRWSP